MKRKKTIFAGWRTKNGDKYLPFQDVEINGETRSFAPNQGKELKAFIGGFKITPMYTRTG